MEEAINSLSLWNATKRSIKKNTENVSVGLGSWEVNVKFFKDRFCRMMDTEILYRGG